MELMYENLPSFCACCKSIRYMASNCRLVCPSLNSNSNSQANESGPTIRGRSQSRKPKPSKIWVHSTADHKETTQIVIHLNVENMSHALVNPPVDGNVENIPIDVSVVIRHAHVNLPIGGNGSVQDYSKSLNGLPSATKGIDGKNRASDPSSSKSWGEILHIDDSDCEAAESPRETRDLTPF